MGSHPDDILLRLQQTVQSWADEVTEAHNSLTRQITESKEQLSTLVRVLAARNQNSQQVLQTIEEAEHLKVSLTHRAAELEESRDTATAREQRIADLEAERDRLLERDAAHQSENQSLAVQLAEARSTSEAAQAERDRLINELEALRTTLRERDEAVTAANQSTISLAEALEGIREEFTQWRSASQEADKAKATLEQELAQLREAVAGNVSGGERERELRGQLDAANEALAAEKESAASLKAERDALDAHVSELRARVTAAEERAQGSDQTNEARAALQAERDALETQVAELQSRVSAAEARAGEVEQTKEDRGRLEAELEEMRRALDGARTAAQQAEQASADSKAEIASLEAAVADRDARLSERDGEIARLREEMERTAAESASPEELARLKERAEQAQAESERLQAELARLQEREAASAQSLDETQVRAAELEARANEAGRLEEERDALDQQVRDLEAELAYRDRPKSPHEGEETVAGAVEDASTTDGLAELKAELLTVEAFLLERESMIESAARQLARLDDIIAGLEAAPTAWLGENAGAPADGIAEVRGLVADFNASTASLKASAYATLDDERSRLTLEALESPERTERMGRMLVDCGVLTEALFNAAMAACREGVERPLAKTLLDEGIDPMEAVRAVIEGRARAEAGAVRAKLTDAEEALAARSAELAETRAQLQQSEEALANREETMAEQEASLDRFQSDLENIMERKQEDDASTQRLNSLLEEARAQIDALNSTIAEREAEVEELRNGNGAAADDASSRIRQAAFDANGRKRAIGEILVNAGVITEAQLASALDEQRASSRKRLGSVLVEKGYIREEIIAQVLASQLKLPFRRIDASAIDAGAIGVLDGHQATHHMCMPLSKRDNVLELAMANPLDLIAIEDVELATQLEVHPVVATLADITSAVVQCYGALSSNLEEGSTEPGPA